MATAKVINIQGGEVEDIDLNPAVFEVEMVPALVHVVAVALMNAARQGNHETKVRKEVRGGGRKPFRQKGTGNARRGSTREPHLRGGGTVFGPHKRSYRQNVPVAVKRKALCCVLTDRLRNDGLRVLDSLAVDGPKTKAFAQIVAGIAPEGGRTLFVTKDVNDNAVRSARNLQRVDVRTASDLNVLDVLAAKNVVVEKEAVAVLEARLEKRRKAVEA
jgi:large subunit ribosomal protein L4